MTEKNVVFACFQTEKHPKNGENVLCLRPFALSGKRLRKITKGRHP
jgi:hypothetical protein